MQEIILTFSTQQICFISSHSYQTFFFVKRVFLRFPPLSMAVSQYIQFFIFYQTLKLNSKNRKTKTQHYLQDWLQISNFKDAFSVFQTTLDLPVLMFKFIGTHFYFLLLSQSQHAHTPLRQNQRSLTRLPSTPPFAVMRLSGQLILMGRRGPPSCAKTPHAKSLLLHLTSKCFVYTSLSVGLKALASFQDLIREIVLIHRFRLTL